MRTYAGATYGLLNRLPKQLGATVHYSVSVSGGVVAATKDETSVSCGDAERIRPDVLARTIADKGTASPSFTVPLLVQRLSSLSDAQLDQIEETFESVCQFTQIVRDPRKGTNPFDFFLGIVADEFDALKLSYVREFSTLTKSLPGTINTCMALQNAEVEVNEANILTHFGFAQKLTEVIPNIWITIENYGPYYYPVVVNLVHENKDRVDDIISFLQERRTLESIDEYLAAGKPMASGVL